MSNAFANQISILQARKQRGILQHQPPTVSRWSTSSSSIDSEPELHAAKCSRQLDITQYPDLEEVLQKMQDFYQAEHNVHRHSAPLRGETWRKLRMHVLSECIRVHVSLFLMLLVL